jgi:hypothetical protein
MKFYSVAVFDASGELVGKGERYIDRLSNKWLSIADAFLSHHGMNFAATWEGPLSHIETKVTSSDGAALVTFSVNSVVTTSIALLAGGSASKEASLLAMFANSLRQVDLVRASARRIDPFSEILEIDERPLMIVVSWGPEAVSEDDVGLVQELSIHLAGAFFERVQVNGGGA